MSPNSNAPAGLSQLRELKVEQSGIRNAAIEANAAEAGMQVYGRRHRERG